MAPATYNAAAARQKLATWRMGMVEPGTTEAHEQAAYDPTEVVELGTKLLASNLNDIERYSILEQVFVAALDKGDIDTATAHLRTIEKRFPFKTSVRVQRLHGMLKESLGEFDKATEIYEAALEQDETNVLIHKRLVAVLVSQGKRTEAIERLVTYVDAFMQDVEGWTELAALYLAENMILQAAFCVEELLLLRPQNHLYHIRYADILYTLGKFDLAVKHYCAALELCKDNTRALYGLRLAAAAVLRQRGKEKAPFKGGRHSSVVQSSKDNGEMELVDEDTLRSLQQLADDRLIATYEKQGKEGAQSTTVLKGWLQANSASA